MRLVAQIVSWVALAATILPSFIYFFDGISLETVKAVMLIATVVWFIATPMWMGRVPAQKAAA
jgi:hypothetical protein